MFLLTPLSPGTPLTASSPQQLVSAPLLLAPRTVPSPRLRLHFHISVSFFPHSCFILILSPPISFIIFFTFILNSGPMCSITSAPGGTHGALRGGASLASPPGPAAPRPTCLRPPLACCRPLCSPDVVLGPLVPAVGHHGPRGEQDSMPHSSLGSLVLLVTATCCPHALQWLLTLSPSKFFLVTRGWS